MILTEADLTALWVTLKLATITTLILLLVGTPLAWWLARTRWRFRFVIEAIIALPLVLPPTVLGFYLLIALGPAGPIGGLMEALGGPTRVYFLRPGDRLRVLFHALRDPATAERLSVQWAKGPWRLPPHCGPPRWTVFSYDRTALAAPGFPHGCRSGVCAHAGRVRGGADDWRQYSRQYPGRLPLPFMTMWRRWTTPGPTGSPAGCC